MPLCPFRTQSGPSSRASAVGSGWRGRVVIPSRMCPASPEESTMPHAHQHWGAAQFNVLLILFCICRPGDGTQTHDQNGSSVTSSCRVIQPVKWSFSCHRGDCHFTHCLVLGEVTKDSQTLNQEVTFLKTRSSSLLPEVGEAPLSTSATLIGEPFAPPPPSEDNTFSFF